MISFIYSRMSSFFCGGTCASERNSPANVNSTSPQALRRIDCGEELLLAEENLEIHNPITCIDAFIESHPEYTQVLQGNTILISCLKRADLLMSSPESLQALDAFLGRSESHIQYSSNPPKIPLLYFAALGGQKQTIEWLISSGGWDLEKKDVFGDSVLDYAVMNKQKNMISWLEDKPRFRIAKVISKLFIIEWADLSNVTEGIRCNVIRLITSTISESDLLEISENLDDLRDLVEDSIKVLSIDRVYLEQIKKTLQKKENASDPDKAFLTLIKVICYVCLESPHELPSNLLDQMIFLARNKYVKKNNSFLGAGVFGDVFKVYHVIDERYYAIKISNDKYHRQKREALENENDMLDRIKTHNPVSSLALKVDWIRCNTYYALVMELHGQNVFHGLIEKMPQGASLTLTKKIAKQLIEALSFLEKIKIVHADVKPENILLRLGSQDQVVLTDFGKSFSLPIPKMAKKYLSNGNECQSLWYRSPECALHTIDRGFDYSFEIDMWSLGCVLIEIFRQKPLFPCKVGSELRNWHMVRLGPYPDSLLSKRGVVLDSLSRQNPSNSPSKLVKNAFTEKVRHREALIRDMGDRDKFIDLVERMLVLDPKKRISTLGASQHGFFKVEGEIA